MWPPREAVSKGGQLVRMIYNRRVCWAGAFRWRRGMFSFLQVGCRQEQFNVPFTYGTKVINERDGVNE